MRKFDVGVLHHFLRKQLSYRYPRSNFPGSYDIGSRYCNTGTAIIPLYLIHASYESFSRQLVLENCRRTGSNHHLTQSYPALSSSSLPSRMHAHACLLPRMALCRLHFKASMAPVSPSLQFFQKYSTWTVKHVFRGAQSDRGQQGFHSFFHPRPSCTTS